MSPFDIFLVAGVAAAFSLYGLVLFTAWLLVTVLPSKPVRPVGVGTPPVRAERPSAVRLAA